MYERHGMVDTPEYKTWYLMKARCYNKNNVSYKYYGGRGIIICERWRKSFPAFLEDMGLKSFPQTEIDRINNNKGYFPDNCQWVSHAQNNQHQSTTKLTMVKAIRIRKEYKKGNTTQKEIGKMYGVGQDEISLIINNRIWKN